MIILRLYHKLVLTTTEFFLSIGLICNYRQVFCRMAILGVKLLHPDSPTNLQCFVFIAPYVFFSINTSNITWPSQTSVIQHTVLHRLSHWPIASHHMPHPVLLSFD